jgi:predicted ATP-grasp superfamily ATP-dependent carboligase
VEWAGVSAVRDRLTVLLVGNYGPSMEAVRSLARAGHRVIAGDHGGFLPVARSRSCHGVWRHPSIDDPDAFVDALGLYVRKRSIDVVLPLRSAFVELLAEHGDRLPDGVALASPRRDVVDTAFDKERMYALAAELGVPHRPTGLANDLDELAALVERIGFPCVIRPGAETTARLPARRKAIIVTAAGDLERQLTSWPPGHGRLLVQGFVGGRRRNIHFAAQDGRILARVQTEAVRTDRPDGTGLGIEGRSVPPDARLDAYCEVIARRLAYTGVGLFQFLVPPDSEPSFLELNPRIGTAIAFVRSCGLDLALAACTLASSGAGWQPPHEWSYPVGRTYAWTTMDIFGLRVARAAGEAPLRESVRWLGRAVRAAVTADTHLTWSARDPLPTVAIVRELLKAPR